MIEPTQLYHPPPTIELEPLLDQMQAVTTDFDQILYQTLVNDGKHIRVLNDRRPQFTFNEKQLRDAAAAEVARISGNSAAVLVEETNDKGSRKRKLLSADEKAQQSRDRNREHAKNTRLRKKAYVSKLKELLDSLYLQKEIDERERKNLSARIYDTHVIRKNAVRLMLSYLATNMQDREKWSGILDEGFILTVPITPYMHFHKSDITAVGRLLKGIDAIIADAASLALVVESLGEGSAPWKESMRNGTGCRLVFSCTKEDMVVAGDLVMCKYVMSIEGYERMGCASGCVQHGMVQCKFDRQNKIIAAELMYDVMGFMQQLQRACNLDPVSSIVPNTPRLALQASPNARIIISAEIPFNVTYINDAFSAATGLHQREVEGKLLQQVVGLTDAQMEMSRLISTLTAAALGRAGRAIVYKDNGDMLYLKALPLSSETVITNRPTHILIVIIF